MFTVDPIWVGGVYIEADQGSDQHGDDFYVTFTGGAPNTQLTRLVIDLDQGLPGLGVADNIFDITESGLGADHAFDFRVEQLSTRDRQARVTALVVDGGTRLEINFENFYAGDRLVFTIDVDEIQHFDPDQTDLLEINLGLDPITSGVEFQGSKLQASFMAPHYQDIDGQGGYLNRYDTLLLPSGLNLPADNDNGLRDRTAGTAFSVTQIPKPISLAGTVFVDNNVNLVQEPAESGLAGVQLELFRKQGSGYISTGHRATTDGLGQYRFGLSLNLSPGTYQIRQTQPDGYFSVGAIPGVLDGNLPVGQSLIENKDLLTEIVIPLGDQHARQLNFAEAQPASLSGYVYADRSNDGRRDAGESGIGGISVRLEAIDGLEVFPHRITTTNADGFYRFDNLSPGFYRIVEVAQPATYFDGLDTPGTVLNQRRGQVSTNDAITDIQVFGDEDGIEFNFGELPPSALSGHVCVAMPGFDCFSSAPNSSQPLSGVLIELLDGQGRLVATTSTGLDGSYRFEAIPAGVYSIVETTPADLLDGASRRGSIDGQAVGDDSQSSRIDKVILNPGQIGTNFDFCELRPASLSGHVFEDANNDGFRQPSEPLLPNTTVKLFDESGVEIAQLQTDEDGFYRFSLLRPGRYRVAETTPPGYIDGRDQVGTIAGLPVGIVDPTADVISEIVLGSGLDGIDYNFGELRPASIAGRVILDSNGNCILDAAIDGPLPDIRVELLDSAGKIIQTQLTDAEGRYRFENLLPGQYAIREQQPLTLLQGSSDIGSGGGRVDSPDLLVEIPIASGDELVEYNFCEVPPATISGYVFQDGPTLITTDGKLPAQLRPLRDGMRDAEDTPIAGVVLELRTLTGQPFPSDRALPGVYTGPTITVTTGPDGFFEFRGLRPGTYHIYQRQPVGYADGLDSAGTTGGFAINAEDTIDDFAMQILLDSLKQESSTDPGFDAILKVFVLAGEVSTENNFSEILVDSEPTPVPPLAPPPTPRSAWAMPGLVSLPFERYLVMPPPTPDVPALLVGGGGSGEYSWHLSIINAGTPRGSLTGRRMTRRQVAQAASILDVRSWSITEHGSSHWVLASRSIASWETVHRQAFDVEGATTLAGDFNGDAIDELALFYEGEWLIDINGNGRWDDADLWARLGEADDLPVVGDWDADGKDDIGVFGPAWEGDDRVLEHEPGLPDPENRRAARPKNIPPSPASHAPQERYLQRSATGPARADVIDHVFRFGTRSDQPIAGDFNGDGVDSIGLFSQGRWRLDTNGDGRWTADHDQNFEFGQTGDIAVVGDFDGDGIDEIAVVRGSLLMIDSNHNQQLDATDQVFQLEGDGRSVVVCDLDGDGRDEASILRRDDRLTEESSITREARKATGLK
jgi:protocatechuate 3,4-dioxygenase beta subunit